MKLDAPQTIALLEKLIAMGSPAAPPAFSVQLRLLRDLIAERNCAELSPRDIASRIFPSAKADSHRTLLTKFRGHVEAQSAQAGLDFRLIRPDARGKYAAEILCHFEGTPLLQHDEISRLLTASATAIRPDTPLVRPRIAAFRSSELATALTTPLCPATDGRERVRFFVSYAHADAEQAKRLLTPLITDLQNSKSFDYDFWRDHLIAPGERWHDEIQDALRDCDFGLALVSRDYLASRYITEHELPSLVTGEKPLIPVCLGLLDFGRHNLRGLEARQIYRYEASPGQMRCFGECRAPMTEKFVADLAGKIEHQVEKAITSRKQTLAMQAATDPAQLAALAHHFPGFHRALSAVLHKPSPPVSPEEKPDHADEAPSEADDTHEPEDATHLLRLFATNALPPAQAAAVQAACAALKLSEAQQLIGKDNGDTDSTSAALERERRDALTYLTQWFRDPDQPPFAAVLGEIGSGKTTMLQMLARELSGSGSPPVFFVDLKVYTGDQNTTLEHLLSDQLRRHDRSGKLTPQDILHAVQTQGALIIFDGLDEKIIPLADGPRQRFIGELFRVLPPDVMDRPASSGRGRMIISCRSHYFPSVLALASGLTGQDREQVKARDYSACIMLPWRDEQVADYLRQELGEDKVASALETIAAVHNLTELSRRPYLLSKIVPQIHRLELERSAGRPVNEASLYRGFVEEWLQRDEGKHVFTKEHKVRMMERLAADLWRDHAREWPWEKVAEWLDGFLFDHPKIAARYDSRHIAADILNADFRTATFFLRPDAAKDGFRFAHTSLQEFFLASHLVKSLLASGDVAAAWALPQPSFETLDFLGQLLALEPSAVKERALSAMAQVLASDSLPAASLAFEYWLRAIEKGHPEPEPEKVCLPALNLEERVLRGHGPGRPLNLRGADLRGVQFSRSTLRHVDLSGADLTGAELRQAVLEDVRAAHTTLSGADFSGVQWKGGSLAGARLVDAKIDGCDWIEVDRSGAELPPDWDTLASTCGDPSGQMPAPQVEAGAVAFLRRMGHTNPVTSCAWSPDGEKLLSGSGDHTLRVWEARSGKCLLTVQGHAGPVNACAWSPDGRRLLSASYDATLKVWDAETGKRLVSFHAHERTIAACAWSPDGRRLLSASYDATLKVWDADTGKRLLTLEGHSDWVWTCAWSPDGRRLLSGSGDRTLRIWEADSGRCLLSLKGHTGSIRACAWSPDGSRLLSASHDDTLKVWDADSGKCLLTLQGHTGWVTACAWSPDGRKLLSGSSDTTLKVWQADGGRCMFTLKGHMDSVMACAWSPTGSNLLSGSCDHTLKVWEADAENCVLTLAEPLVAVSACAWSPDGQKLLAGFMHGTTIWEVASGKRHFALLGNNRLTMACAWSPNGEKLLSGSAYGTVEVWEPESKKSLLAVPGSACAVRACAWNPDGEKVVSSFADGRVELWEAATGTCLLNLAGHVGTVGACAWSPDGRKLLSGAADRTLKLWETTSGTCLFTLKGHAGGVSACTWSPDAKNLLSGSADRTLKVWDAGSGKCLLTLEEHMDAVTACVWSPDGEKLLSGSDDRTLKVWDVRSGNCLLTLKGHSDTVSACAWSPDGEKLLSGSRDGTLKVWDAHTGECLQTFHHLPDGDYATVDERIVGTVPADTSAPLPFIQACSPGAWKHFGWRWTDPRTSRQRLLPAEHFGRFPA